MPRIGCVEAKNILSKLTEALASYKLACDKYEQTGDEADMHEVSRLLARHDSQSVTLQENLSIGTRYELAREIMGEQFIGLEKILKLLNYPDTEHVRALLPPIPFSPAELKEAKAHSELDFLILRVGQDITGVHNYARLLLVNGANAEKRRPFIDMILSLRSSFLDVESSWALSCLKPEGGSPDENLGSLSMSLINRMKDINQRTTKDPELTDQMARYERQIKKYLNKREGYFRKSKHLQEERRKELAHDAFINLQKTERYMHSLGELVYDLLASDRKIMSEGFMLLTRDHVDEGYCALVSGANNNLRKGTIPAALTRVLSFFSLWTTFQRKN